VYPEAASSIIEEKPVAGLRCQRSEYYEKEIGQRLTVPLEA
jgi:hypothetical protein